MTTIGSQLLILWYALDSILPVYLSVVSVCLKLFGTKFVLTGNWYHSSSSHLRTPLYWSTINSRLFHWHIFLNKTRISLFFEIQRRNIFFNPFPRRFLHGKIVKWRSCTWQLPIFFFRFKRITFGRHCRIVIVLGFLSLRLSREHIWINSFLILISGFVNNFDAIQNYVKFILKIYRDFLTSLQLKTKFLLESGLFLETLFHRSNFRISLSGIQRTMFILLFCLSQIWFNFCHGFFVLHKITLNQIWINICLLNSLFLFLIKFLLYVILYWTLYSLVKIHCIASVSSCSPCWVPILFSFCRALKWSLFCHNHFGTKIRSLFSRFLAVFHYSLS